MQKDNWIHAFKYHLLVCYYFTTFLSTIIHCESQGTPKNWHLMTTIV